MNVNYFYWLIFKYFYLNYIYFCIVSNNKIIWKYVFVIEKYEIRNDLISVRCFIFFERRNYN